MEPSQAPRRFPYLVAVVVLTAAAAVFLYRKPAVAPLGQLARADLPILELVVKLKDAKGNELAPDGSKIAGAEAAPAGDDRCQALFGGDTSQTVSLPLNQKRPADCPKVATWYVKRHPIAFTVYFGDGEAFLDWFDASSRARELASSKFFQGLFFEPLHNLKVRAEDLHLQGLEGEFMRRLVREAIAAHGQLHYDMAHGRKGFVLSFVRDESPFAAKALPVMAAALAQSGYRVAKLPEPVLEMRIGLQRIFLAQQEDRIYLANGLEALLNVIDSLTAPSDGLPDAPVALTIRAEAFVDKILPVMTGAPTWDVTAAFDLKNGHLGSLVFPSGKFARHLHPQIFQGVFASIPHDVFGAVAGGFHLSPAKTAEDWRKLATEGPDDEAADEPKEAGFALLWDFDSAGQAPFGEVGFVIASQTAPEASASYHQYLANPDLGADCAGGTVFLAATSSKLLTRMKEACTRQSLSVLDWERGAARPRFEAAQLAGFVNPGAALRELFLAGGAASGDRGDFEPRWKQEYENAKAAMRQDGEKVFRSLPIFVYAGKAGWGKTVTLDGFAVTQGVAP